MKEWKEKKSKVLWVFVSKDIRDMAEARPGAPAAVENALIGIQYQLSQSDLGFGIMQAAHCCQFFAHIGLLFANLLLFLLQRNGFNAASAREISVFKHFLAQIGLSVKDLFHLPSVFPSFLPLPRFFSEFELTFCFVVWMSPWTSGFTGLS